MEEFCRSEFLTQLNRSSSSLIAHASFLRVIFLSHSNSPGTFPARPNVDEAASPMAAPSPQENDALVGLERVDLAARQP